MRKQKWGSAAKYKRTRPQHSPLVPIWRSERNENHIHPLYPTPEVWSNHKFLVSGLRNDSLSGPEPPPHGGPHSAEQL